MEVVTMDLLSQLSPAELLLLQWTNNLLRYFLIAGLTYMVFWKWCFSKFQDRFLYQAMPAKTEFMREMKYSVLTTLLFIMPTALIVLTKPFGLSQLYFQIADYSITWYVLSFLVVFFLHDTYFYWTHRLMHTKKLYPYFHKVHHLSKDPSPLAAFAFHPLEALVESFIFVLLPFVLPLHWTVLVFFTLFSLFMNVYGHLGFNLFSKPTRDAFPLNLLNHSTHHSWHHRFYKGNYGFYLKFWDKVMGTYGGELK
jgi:lathosterol oxidase